jgi:hypothetical protein
VVWDMEGGREGLGRVVTMERAGTDRALCRRGVGVGLGVRAGADVRAVEVEVSVGTVDDEEAVENEVGGLQYVGSAAKEIFFFRPG